MRTLERRLQRLEAFSALHVSPEMARQRASAMSAIFEVLYAHYPDDPWTSVNLYQGRKSASNKVSEAAQRVQAGRPTETDLRAIAEMPAYALDVFERTGAEMLVTVGSVLDQF